VRKRRGRRKTESVVYKQQRAALHDLSAIIARVENDARLITS